MPKTKGQEKTENRSVSKGCNCKRSGCLKNYCECYETKVTCSLACKCMGCRNVVDRRQLASGPVPPKAPKTSNRTIQKRPHQQAPKATQAGKFTGIGLNQKPQPRPSVNKSYNFITPEVVDASIRCMFAQAEECKKNNMPPEITERMVLEELDKCLIAVMDFSIKNVKKK